MYDDPTYLFPGYVSRSASFENPQATPGGGGLAGNGRKGAASKLLEPGERVILADMNGPGTITHLWATLAAAGWGSTPAFRRAQVLEVFYDGATEPSVSVPALDLFGAVHGVPSPYASRLSAVNEVAGFTSRIPMPFHDSIRMEWCNASDHTAILYYQVDALLGPLAPDRGVLHATFRRENPTNLREDFVVTDGLQGPGRFLGWTGGVRVFEPQRWWGEGEVKVYFDGEKDPTICGTGAEDYLDSAWGLGTFHAPETGAPLVWKRKGDPDEHHRFVSFYRWHLSDPIVFERDMRVTIQQIGATVFREGQEEEMRRFKEEGIATPAGWIDVSHFPGLIGATLYERIDDWCGTAFVYCAKPQPVPRVDVQTVTEDLPDPNEHELVRRQ